ncbi:hypothetical protein GCM10011487_69790 [Steroidobacter agaridevorans]|uniref:Uncharacterized protein n=2 Tax=Steroidobacter agaridevorans TaxID=2695856 RepID=A0A829YP97_9GAMM|nr:hypothetical protein GCM10011487_69790 [Steroidobacter agaridevorans]
MPIIGMAAQWQRYENGEDGFTVSLPVSPSKREQIVEATDTFLRTYEAVVSGDHPYKLTISVGMPRKRGYYYEKSMDAFLDAFPESMMRGASEGKLKQSRRTTFRDMPARQFRFTHLQMDHEFVSQGIVFMIDGGYIRVSSLTMADDPQGEVIHERLINSFQLRALSFLPSPSRLNDSRGVSFTPPNGWVKKSQQDPNEIATYARMTRWLDLLSTFNPAYTCRAYQEELKNLGRSIDTRSVMFSDQSAMRVLTNEMPPGYNVRLATVHYCLDSQRIGAVVFKGTAEGSIFWRYERLFEGAARTLRIQ